MKPIKLNLAYIGLAFGVAVLQGCSITTTSNAPTDLIGPRVTFAWQGAMDDLYRVPGHGGSNTKDIKISQFPDTPSRLGPFISTGRKCSGGPETCRMAVVLLNLRYQVKLEGNTWVLEGEVSSSAHRSAEVKAETRGGSQTLMSSIPNDVPFIDDEPPKTLPFRWVVDAKKPLALPGILGAGFTLSAAE